MRKWYSILPRSFRIHLNDTNLQQLKFLPEGKYRIQKIKLALRGFFKDLKELLSFFLAFCHVLSPHVTLNVDSKTALCANLKLNNIDIFWRSNFMHFGSSRAQDHSDLRSLHAHMDVHSMMHDIMPNNGSAKLKSSKCKWTVDTPGFNCGRLIFFYPAFRATFLSVLDYVSTETTLSRPDEFYPSGFRLKTTPTTNPFLSWGVWPKSLKICLRDF